MMLVAGGTLIGTQVAKVGNSVASNLHGSFQDILYLLGFNDLPDSEKHLHLLVRYSMMKIALSHWYT
jgi:hypothetical protein